MEQKILMLNNKDVEALGVADMKEALHDVEATLALVARKDALHPFKVAMEWPADQFGPQNRINAMPGFLGGEYQMAGVKWIGSNPKNLEHGLPRASALTILNDPITKLPVCIMDGTAISAMRTGASGGVGIKYLAKENSKSIVMIGAGAQSRTQLEAALLARPSLREIYVYDLFSERAEAYANEMGEKLGHPITPIVDPKPYCQKADIIVTATVSENPVVDADWLRPGVLFVQIGGNECTYDAVRKADKRVCDEWVHVLHRKGSTIALMGEEGLITEQDIYADLGEIINGQKPGRENDSEIIYYNPVGMGNEDIAVATRIYRHAVEQQRGQIFQYWE